MNIGLIIFVVLIAIFAFYMIKVSKKLKKITGAEPNEKIIILSQSNFAKETKDCVALVDFWADWCMPCKMIAPMLNELAEEMPLDTKICKVNVDQEQQLAGKFGVRSIPTLIILKNGVEVNRFIGAKSKDFLLKEINKINNI